MAEKYQNSADLNAAMQRAVKDRKEKVAAVVDPKIRRQEERTASRRKRSVGALVVLTPLSLAAIWFGARQMGFYVGSPPALSAAMANPAGAESLNLTHTNLASCPSDLFRLTTLKTLILDSNGLSDLPASMSVLSKLKVLSVQYNALTSLPPELGKLTSLEELRVNGNRLTELPETLMNLKALKVLDLTGNELTTLPKNLGALSNLRVLRLGGNKLTSFPASMSTLSHLQELDVSGVPASTLPDPESFPELRSLILRGSGVSKETAAAYKAKLGKVSVMR